MVALLGAHSVGQADPANTGFDGEWTPGQIDIFDNQYYLNMLDPKLNWKNKVIISIS